MTGESQGGRGGGEVDVPPGEGDAWTVLTVHHGTAVVQVPGHYSGHPDQQHTDQHHVLPWGGLHSHSVRRDELISERMKQILID